MANVLKCLTNVLWTLVNHSKIQNQAYPQVFHDIVHSVETILTTDCTDWTDQLLELLELLEPLEPLSGCKTKTGKTPCVGCKMSLTSH